MPTPLLSRINLDLIFPTVAVPLFELVARCRKKGADYYAISGTRSFDEQQRLWNQGRVTPGKVVTNARPGKSAHQFGLAIDFCRDADATRDGLQADWNLEHYQLLADEAKAMGLDPAFYWTNFREGPHVQLNLKAKNIELEELRRVYLRRQRLQDVWDWLDVRGPW